MLLDFFSLEREASAHENHPTRERRDAAGREEGSPAASRLFSHGVIFTRARTSSALLSVRENEGLLVVYCNL